MCCQGAEGALHRAAVNAKFACEGAMASHAISAPMAARKQPRNVAFKIIKPLVVGDAANQLRKSRGQPVPARWKAPGRFRRLRGFGPEKLIESDPARAP
jgi:hypothetical protein